MTVRQPLVSVVIPTFNCRTYLPAAIDSILAQTCADVEIIVVDDGSTDGTRDVLEAFGDRVRYVAQAQQGAGAARNTGVTLAGGEFLAFLDADDVFTPEKVAVQAQFLCASPHIHMVFGQTEEFVSVDLPGDVHRRLQARPGRHVAYFAGTMLIRRESFDVVGPFEAGWRVGEFVDWYLRALDAGLRAAVVPQVVLRRRLHGDNTGIRERDARGDYARILKHALDRRRLAGPA
jgi:glycosyltransferase involved in cell wall biosynthesis